jgi:putative addiction module killer protein
MKEIRQTDMFEKWLNSLKDFKTVKVIKREIDKLALGITSHTKPIGKGLFELKVHLGKGIRIYFINKDEKIIILLSGGNKTSQKKDIGTARKLKEDIGD